MSTMIITIERSPRTLQLGDTVLQVEELSARLPFARWTGQSSVDTQSPLCA